MAGFCFDASADTLFSVAVFMLIAIGMAIGWLHDAREARRSQEYYDATEEGLQ